jgi:serine protease
MESAWDISTGSGAVVAVLDTGVAYENYGPYCQAPDLAGTTFVPGYDFVNNDAHPNDDNWHGTHVAGTIAQTTNNGYGFAGVAFDCTIMPVKIANATNFEPGVKNMRKYITYLGSSNILRVKLLYP